VALSRGRKAVLVFTTRGRETRELAARHGPQALPSLLASIEHQLLVMASGSR
jgi:hypothetical protein